MSAPVFELLIAIKSYLQLALLIAVCAAAWRWGGIPERAIALILLGVLKIGDVLHHLFWGMSLQFNTLNVGHFLLDAIAAALLLAVALRADRIYPLWLAAIQIIVLLTHLASTLVSSAPFAYAIMSIAPSYVLILVLALGTATHRHRNSAMRQRLI